MTSTLLRAAFGVGALACAFSAAPAQAQTWSQLNALPGTMEGAPMVNSNNPESVTREGLLLATEPMISADANRVTRTLSTGTLDSACPAGSLREFAFYMHHLLGAPSGTDAQVTRVYVLLEPAGTSATFNAFGAAISQSDISFAGETGLLGKESTLDPGRSPSYSVSLASLTGTLPSWVTSTANGSAFVNVSGATVSQGSVFALANLRGTRGASLDARIKVRATAGCLKVRVVAASDANGSVALANALGKRVYAWGNVASTYDGAGVINQFGGTPCSNRQSQNTDGTYNWSGWGRSAGIYQFERWRGTHNVSLTATTQSLGYRFLAAPSNLIRSTNFTATPSGVCSPTTGDPSPSSNAQRAPALRHYTTNTSGVTGGRDSDPWSTANYGAEYAMTHNVTNSSGGCVTARLQITMYPGQQACSANTAAKTRHWDGAFSVTENSVFKGYQRTFVKCNTSPGSQSKFIPPEAITVSTIASKVMRNGEIVRWDIKGFVPGLISAPGAFLVTSAPATCP